MVVVGGGDGGVKVVVLLIVVLKHVPMYLLLSLSLKIEVQICLVRLLRGNYGNVVETYKTYHIQGLSGQGYTCNAIPYVCIVEKKFELLANIFFRVHHLYF